VPAHVALHFPLWSSTGLYEELLEFALLRIEEPLQLRDEATPREAKWEHRGVSHRLPHSGLQYQ